MKYQPIAWALVLSCTKAPGSHVLCVASWGPSPETPPGRLCCVVYRESTRAHEVEHHRQPLPLCAAPSPGRLLELFIGSYALATPVPSIAPR